MYVPQVFGWLTAVVWVCTLWFLFKDTTFFNDPKAPWARFQKKKEIATPDIQQNPVHERAKGKLISYF